MREQTVGQLIVCGVQTTVELGPSINVGSGIFLNIGQLKMYGLRLKVLATHCQEVVAGWVPIQQVGHHPSCTGLPSDSPPVNNVGGQVHPGMIVEVACLGQRMNERVDAR